MVCHEKYRRYIVQYTKKIAPRRKNGIKKKYGLFHEIIFDIIIMIHDNIFYAIQFRFTSIYFVLANDITSDKIVE